MAAAAAGRAGQQSDSQFLATISEWPLPLTLQVQQRGSRFLATPRPLTTEVQQRGLRLPHLEDVATADCKGPAARSAPASWGARRCSPCRPSSATISSSRCSQGGRRRWPRRPSSAAHTTLSPRIVATARQGQRRDALPHVVAAAAAGCAGPAERLPLPRHALGMAAVADPAGPAARLTLPRGSEVAAAADHGGPAARLPISGWPPPLTKEVQQRGHLEEVAAAARARRDLSLLGWPPLLALQA